MVKVRRCMRRLQSVDGDASQAAPVRWDPSGVDIVPLWDALPSRGV
jgi:hypothetical protein